MTYKLYFMFQKDSGRFDPDGLRAYAKWAEAQLVEECLRVSVEIADPLPNQTLYPSQYKALLSFEFRERNASFDAFKPKYVEILDKMEEFTDTPPLMHGTFVD